MLKFRIEQVAISPRDPIAAKKLLSEMGVLTDWVEDHVTAVGKVWDRTVANEADLSFNYEVFRSFRGANTELEVLHYTKGDNWLVEEDRHEAELPLYTTSHFGMHVSDADLDYWRKLLSDRGIKVAQEVFTESHTNPFLQKTGRKYHYVIFNTRPILGVDIKFIVRIDKK